MAYYDNCFPVSRTVGTCGQVIACAIEDKKFGATQPPPYVNPLNYHMEKRLYLPGTIKNVNGNLYDFDCVWGGGNFGYPADPNVTLRLLGNLVSKVRDHSFNAGVSLAEGKEAIKMLGSTSHQLASLCDRLPGINGKVRVIRQVLASRWLEAVYGWMPLISDMKSAAWFLASHLNRPRQQTWRAATSTNGFATSTSPINWMAAGSAKKLYYASVTLSEDDSRDLGLLGHTNFSEIAWELTPYSFVADWFIPVGDWLRVRNYLADLKAPVGYWGIFRKEKLWCAAVLNPNNTLIRGPHNEIIVLDRVPSPLSVPPPRFTPLSQVFSSWRHCVDGLALASVAFGKVKLSRNDVRHPNFIDV